MWLDVVLNDDVLLADVEGGHLVLDEEALHLVGGRLPVSALKKVDIYSQGGFALPFVDITKS